MKKTTFLILLIAALMLLVACGGEQGSESAAISDSSSNGNSGTGAETAGDDSATDTTSDTTSSDTTSDTSSDATSDSAPATDEKVRLAEDYSDALPVLAQLAVGTLRLEDTGRAVDEAAAEKLLPLWQALQSLSGSDTTAEVEIQAVVNQIQGSMSPDQVAAIAAMKLTQADVDALVESGELSFGRGGSGRGDGEEGQGGGFGQGGGPGGGSGGGRGPAGLGEMSEEDIATRRAEFAGGNLEGAQDRMYPGLVVRYLQEKTGEVLARGGIFSTVFTVVGEAIGLSSEAIQEQTADGSSLAEVIEANGGDVESIREALIDAFNELPNAEDLDAEQLATEWLGE